MRIIIAGSRNFDNYKFLKLHCIKILRELKDLGYNISPNNIEIISGAACGVDLLGAQFADEVGLKCNLFPADWDNLKTKPCKIAYNKGKKYNLLAGYNRNKEMARYANEDKDAILISFWDGKSKSTKNMIEVAKEFNLKIFMIKIEVGD